MKRISAFLLAAIAGLVLCLFASAAFATELNPGSTVVDLSGLFANAKELMYMVLALAAAALYGWLQKFPIFNKLITQEQYRKLIDPLLDDAVAFGVGKLSNADWLKIDTKNEALAMAAQYAVDHGGDLLKKFGISRDMLEEKLEAKLVANGWDKEPGKWQG